MKLLLSPLKRHSKYSLSCYMMVAILFFVFSSQAQVPYFKRYTVDDGLPSSFVYRIMQDSQGFLWVSTDKGISRFDGYEFQKFGASDGLPSNDIWGSIEDNNKRVWLCTFSHHFSYFDIKTQKFTIIQNTLSKQQHHNLVWGFVPLQDKILVLSNKLPLCLIDKQNKVTPPTLEQKSFLNSFNTNLHYNHNIAHLRIFSENLDYFIQGNPFKHPSNYDWTQGELILSASFSKKNLFDCTENNLFASADGQKGVVKNIKTLSVFLNNHFLYLSPLQQGKLALVLTEKENFVINDRLERIQKYDFINSFKINTIFLDKEQNLWICTKDKGLLMVSKESIEAQSFDNLKEQAIKIIVPDSEGRLWMGTDLGEIFVYQNGKTIKVFSNASVRVPIRKIAITSDNNLFISWQGAYFLYEPIKKVLEQSQIGNVYKSQEIENIHDIRTYKISGKNTLALYKHNDIKDFIEIKTHEKYLVTSIPIESVIQTSSELQLKIHALNIPKSYKIAEGENGSFWLGTSLGLALLNKDKMANEFESEKSKYPALGRLINDFAFDHLHRLWVATDGEGVYHYDTNKKILLRLGELDYKIVKSLYFDKKTNRLWCATNEGVFVTQLGDNQEFKTYKISLAQGLPTQEIHSVYAKGNTLYAGTNEGLVIINLEDFFKRNITSKAPLWLKNIKINRKDTLIQARYELPYDQNNLDISFVALSYKSLRNIRYDYKMLSENERDTLWHEARGRNKEFLQLSPGKYTFSLRAFDIEGKSAQAMQPIVFIIRPPFWKTTWFLLAFFTVLALIIGGIIYGIIRRASYQNRVNQRFATLELNALQAQMNPHFIFNALSSIQNVVLKKDNLVANQYLTNFAKLMRLYLESSRNKYISIKDEIELERKYIELEQLRFQHKFTYQIITDPALDVNSEIPSMLIQPFVENSINHGVIFLESGGLIKIEFKKIDDSTIVCLIDDNGIGRKNATEIKKGLLKPYKSRGMELVQERLKTIKKIAKTTIDIEVVDKLDHENKSNGTQVVITIKI
jgi:ligand-binding sensor domain-containing protein